MTRSWFAALLLTATFLAPSPSHATAPSVVEPSYDVAAKTLSVKIRHWSLANSLHYVKFVEVKVNGTVLLTTPYDRQSATEYTYTYNVAAVPGDVIEVTARCNLWGSRTVGLTVPQPAAAAVPSPAPGDSPKAEPAPTSDK